MLAKILAFMFLVFSLVFSINFAIAAADKAGINPQLRGRIVLWERAACAEFSNCELPRELGIKWDIEALLIAPTEMPGAISPWSIELREGGWMLRLLIIWKAAAPPVPAHIITQALLFREQMGLVAECSRYDSLDDFFPFAPGSCAGLLGGKQVGISFLRR